MIYAIFGGIVIICIAAGLAIFLYNKDFTTNILIDYNKRIFMLFTILFIVLLSISLIIYQFRHDPYIRPKIYFIIYGIMGVVLFLQILYSDSKKSSVPILIIEIITFSGSFILTQMLMYNSALGIDPWAHQYLTNLIIDNGHIPNQKYLASYPYLINGLYNYCTMPGMHLIMAQNSIVTFLPYHRQLISIGLVSMILIVLVVYLIGVLIHSSKFGLICAFFVSFADNIINMIGMNIIPNTIGTAIVIIVFYLLLRNSVPNFKKNLLVMLLTFFVVMTHTISYVLLIILLLTYAIFHFIKQWLFKTEKNHFILNKIVLFSVLGLFYWGWISKFYFNSMVNLVKNTLLMDFSGSEYLRRLSVSLNEMLLARSGMIFFFILVLIGIICTILYFLRSRKIGNLLLISANASIFMCIGFLGTLSPAFSGIAHRFWFFGQIFGAPLIALLVIVFLKNQSKKIFKKIVISFLVFSLVLLNVFSNIANNDMPIAPEYSLHTGLYDSEINAANFLISKCEMPFASDLYYSTRIVFMGGDGWEQKCPESISDFINDDSFVSIIRLSALEGRRFALGDWRPIYFNSNTRNSIISKFNARKNIIYSNNTVFLAI